MLESSGDLAVQVIRRTVTREDGDAFLEVPFEVPAGTEEVAVHCAVQGVAHAGEVLDLGLRDPLRVRGASGSARSEFSVGQEEATPGYLAGDVTPGEWAVLLNLPLCAKRIPPEGCTATFTIRCRLSKPQWLKGDLHTHSTHSDGSCTVDELVACAQTRGLDFIALTDRNTVSQNFAYRRNPSVVVIPGAELTTRRGDCNLLGVADPFDDFRVDSIEALRDRLGRARQKGAKIVLNHPHSETQGWTWGWEEPYDGLEVWNGAWQERDRRTLAWWHAQLVAGKRPVAVGGSDAHGRELARPTTWVYSASRTVGGILGALERGHVCLSCCPEGPAIDPGYGAGAALEEAASPRHRAELAIRRLRRGDTIRVVSERGLEREVTLDTDEESLLLAWPIEGRCFYRAEVWRGCTRRGAKQMAALSNPIYLGPRGSTF